MNTRWCWPLILFLLCVCGADAVRGDLVFTNYTAANPLEVLASGDSITDDSVTNGAWRAYLGKLLATNGYNFTNLGRWSSTVAPGFTQVHHEGMDGAVIAAPGLSGPTHGYTAVNNYALLTLANAFTNAFFPDLVLIDLGVNDMGRGRNPLQVATNDLSALLDLVFSKVPSANVIISKPTTITYSTILSPPYMTYKTNMYIYCEAVQALAAARRAQGQNVFVADLFSAVYGSGMLNSDGTHPNSTGLAAIANEMMLRIASITHRPDSVTTPFIRGGSTWKYSDQGLNLGTNWAQPDFDDSTWSQGTGRLGYNVVGITTTIGYGTNASSKYITTYFRRSFVVSNNVSYTNLTVHLNRADGAVVWLNGKELYRVNLPTGTITYQTIAPSPVIATGDDSNTYFATNVPIASLPAGTNVIAVEIHKHSPSGTSLTFDLELFGNGVYLPPTLSLAPMPDGLRLAWPTSYSSFSLQSISSFSATDFWQTVPGPYPVSNNSFEVTMPAGSSQQFFRLIAPGQ